MIGPVSSACAHDSYSLQMVLDALSWTRDSQEANLVLESRLLFANSTDASPAAPGGWTMKMSSATAVLAVLGGDASGQEFRRALERSRQRGGGMLQFPIRTTSTSSSSSSSSVRAAALVLFREKNGKHVLVRVSRIDY